MNQCLLRLKNILKTIKKYKRIIEVVQKTHLKMKRVQNQWHKIRLKVKRLEMNLRFKMIYRRK